MKTLLLLRHAKSSWDDPALADFDRPLAPRGRQAAARMGRLLVARRLSPDIVACSTAQRARETFERLEPQLDVAPELHYEDALYMAEPAALLRLVRSLPDDADSALVIGHNPGLERFAGRLAGSAEGNSLHRMARKFPTAGLAVLRFDCKRWADIAPAGGHLVDFVAPRDAD